MKKTITTIAIASLLAGGAQATVLSINLTNTNAPRQIEASESTGIIDTTGWNNITATTTDVDGTAVDITLGGNILTANTKRDAGGDGTNGFLALYEAGLRDATPGTAGDTFATISDMAAYLTAEGATSYNLYVYYKSGVPDATTPRALAIGMDSSNLTTDNTPDGRDMSVNDSFVALGGTDANYVLYQGLTADSVTVFINKGDRDALLTGVQIETVPEPSSAVLIGLGGLALILRRRK